MKNIFLTILFFTAVLIYGQTSIGSNRIAGSSIVLYNLSSSDVQKIMQGTIFDVFNQDLGGYNTDLKKLTFSETPQGKEYQQRLEDLRGRLQNQGIKTIPLSKQQMSRQFITTISDYDVNNRGFNIFIGYDKFNYDYQRAGGASTGAANTNIINGFRIPNIVFPYFMLVPINDAQKIERNPNAVVQFQLDVNTFAIQKIFIINIDTIYNMDIEVYAEANYEGKAPQASASSQPESSTKASDEKKDIGKVPNWFLQHQREYNPPIPPLPPGMGGGGK